MKRKVDSDRVLRYIEARGLTLRKVAEEMGVSYRTILTYRSTKRVSAIAAMSLAIAEGLPFDFFLLPFNVNRESDKRESQR